MQRIKKPTTHKGKKFILDREPKLIENKKESLFLHGRKGSELINNCLKDLYHLKKPDAIKLGEKNDFLPFESSSEIERLSKKHDASLIFFGSHNKKWPNNLILCRMYGHSILDMVELDVKNYHVISEFKTEKITTGLKTCLIFSGPLFEQDSDLKRIQNMLVDFFQREDATNIRLQGLEHVIMFTATQQDELLMRSYRILLKKSGCKIPRIELEELGPSVDFVIHRKKLASEDLFKQACKVPKELKAKKVKNINIDAFGSKLGRVRMGGQNMHRLRTRGVKGLRRSASERGGIGAGGEGRGADGKWFVFV